MGRRLKGSGLTGKDGVRAVELPATAPSWQCTEWDTFASENNAAELTSASVHRRHMEMEVEQADPELIRF